VTWRDRLLVPVFCAVAFVVGGRPALRTFLGLLAEREKWTPEQRDEYDRRFAEGVDDLARNRPS